MAFVLDSSIEQILCKSGLEITKVVRKSDGLVLWEAYTAGGTQEFFYTGDVQTFIAPATGIYKLEVYGAQGGSTAVSGGKGGYSYGYATLSKGEAVYIYVGGKGGNMGSGVNGAGYNGGGHGSTGDSTEWSAGGGGGGATHIAKRSGLLSTLEEYISDILIVAGGGGGSGHSRPQDNSISYGGAGGGITGGDGINARNNYREKVVRKQQVVKVPQRVILVTLVHSVKVEVVTLVVMALAAAVVSTAAVQAVMVMEHSLAVEVLDILVGL